jgi:hypothetical protein
MRASELIGRDVRCRDGRLGRVIDLRVETDSPPDREVRHLRLDGLVVSPHRWGSTLGYDRRDGGRPWPVRWLVRRLHARDRYVRWGLVGQWAGGVVEVDAAMADLPAVPPLPARS